MKASYCLLLAALLIPPLSLAADDELPFELIELLGEMDVEEIDLEIALADGQDMASPKTTLPEEVQDDE